MPQKQIFLRYFELVAFVVNGKVAEEVFYLTDTVNMLQVILIIKTRTMIIKIMPINIKIMKMVKSD